MNATSLEFRANSPELAAFIAWWESLDKNRGERAVLRRCATLTEIVLTPSYHRLRWALLEHGAPKDEGLALGAALAARVKTNAPNASVAGQMATGKADGSALISDLRFRRLLKIKTREELLPAMTRIIAMLGGTLNLSSLVQSSYWWNERTRKEWAFDYYGQTFSQ